MSNPFLTRSSDFTKNQEAFIRKTVEVYVESALDRKLEFAMLTRNQQMQLGNALETMLSGKTFETRVEEIADRRISEREKQVLPCEENSAQAWGWWIMGTPESLRADIEEALRRWMARERKKHPTKRKPLPGPRWRYS